MSRASTLWNAADVLTPWSGTEVSPGAPAYSRVRAPVRAVRTTDDTSCPLSNPP